MMSSINFLRSKPLEIDQGLTDALELSTETGWDSNRPQGRESGIEGEEDTISLALSRNSYNIPLL